MKVNVPAKPLKNRKIDQAPASITLDVKQMTSVIPQGSFIDAGSIEVIAYDSEGKPIQQNILQDNPYAIPHRWDDFDHRGTKFYYHRKGNGQNGVLTWNHTQHENQASFYAVYFNIKNSLYDTKIGPMHLIGDGDAIYDSNAPLYAGLHLKVDVVDWDGDGLLDFILGDSPGYLQLYKNTGTKTKPVFTDATFLEVDGTRFVQPYCPAFCAVDWDDDGDLDLIYGKEWGGEVFYIENIGTRKIPQMVSRGRLMCDGKPLQTPGKPHRDKPDPSDAWGGGEYMCTPSVVDWDSDGDKDLLLGSYSGGQVYLCENTKNGKGIPSLTWRGYLKDEKGTVIDSDFAASPEIADYDADGDLDMILGAADWTETAGAKPAADSTNMLYYENVGTRTKPVLRKRPFPDALKGKGIESVAVPGAGDIDGDGDLDLIVGTFANVVTYKNVGAPQKPSFQLEGLLLTGWNPVKFGGFASTPFDIDGDGDFDIIASSNGQFKILRNVNSGNPPKFEDAGYLKFGEKEFVYEFPYGDPELFSARGDVDGDGRIDFLWGNGEGYVWYVKNKGIKNGSVIFGNPVRLCLKNGKPVKIGHFKPSAKVNDFSTHSGDRSDPGVADFDRDGDNDLLVSDAYGAITYFENIGTKGHPVYAPGKIIKSEDNNRLLQEVVDWNNDGKPDLLFCRDDVQLWLNTGTGKVPSFTPGGSLLRGQSFPYAQAYAVDWNGDGDVDLMVANSYFILYYFERSYIDYGPIPGTIIDVEKRGTK